MKLSIVIVNWNTIDLLAECLNSIKEHLSGIVYEAVVIDNGSSDKSAEIIKKEYPWVRLIANKENQGFARANNQAFKMARGEYILILNPDTLIKDGSVQIMIKILDEDNRIGIVGPRIVDQFGKVALPCRRSEPSLLNIFYRRFLLEKIVIFIINRAPFFKKRHYRRYYKDGQAECIQGACMLMRKSSLEEVGYFDEKIPMYLDDSDLCYRFRISGFKVYYCAGAEIVHICGASTKRAQDSKVFDLLVYKAVDAFFVKHKSGAHVTIHHAILFSSALILFLVDMIIFPIIFFTSRRYIILLMRKHLNTIRYAVSFKLDIPNFSVYRDGGQT